MIAKLHTWVTTELDDGDIVVRPIRDVVEHDDDKMCICQPQIEEVAPGRFMYSHNAFDGRE